MKLILCRSCQDVFKLSTEKVRTCACGKCAGVYLDAVNALYSGDDAVPIGFGNTTLVYALMNQPANGVGKEFTAFVIPRQCDSMKKVARRKVKVANGRNAIYQKNR